VGQVQRKLKTETGLVQAHETKCAKNKLNSATCVENKAHHCWQLTLTTLFGLQMENKH